jgi:dipeptide/tripeptide permease
MAVSTTKEGERVILDPAITIQRIYMIFYMGINIGCLSLMATPFMEKYKGFWTAYLLCLSMFIAGTTILVLGRKLYVVTPPQVKSTLLKNQTGFNFHAFPGIYHHGRFQSALDDDQSAKHERAET